MLARLAVHAVVEPPQSLRRDALAARIGWGCREAPSCESGCSYGASDKRQQEQVDQSAGGGAHWTTAELMPQESADQISVSWLGRHTS